MHRDGFGKFLRIGRTEFFCCTEFQAEVVLEQNANVRSRKHSKCVELTCHKNSSTTILKLFPLFSQLS